MEMLLKLVAAMFLARERYWSNRCDYERAGTYKTAYHLLAYAIHDREDCISNFDFYEEAARFVHEHPYMDIWDYEEKVGKEIDKWTSEE